MKLASHDSMTYLKPKCWLLYPFKFMAQCQCKNIKKQYAAGAKYYDLRITFDKHQNPIFAHGSMSYNGNVYKTLEELNAFGEKLYVRITNERNKYYELFCDFCNQIENKYENLMFVSGRNKKDWKILYHFKYEEPSLIDKYSSNNHDKCEGYDDFNETNHKNFTGNIFDDLFPRIYAIKNNKKIREKFLNNNERDFLMMDFIGKY